MLGCAVLFLSKGDEKKKLEYIFDFYDTNHDGSVNIKELKEGYKAMFAMLGTENVDLLCKQMAEDTMKDIGSTQDKISKSNLLILNKI